MFKNEKNKILTCFFSSCVFFAKKKTFFSKKNKLVFFGLQPYMGLYQFCENCIFGVKGEGNGKINIFKELMPLFLTYELHGQGREKKKKEVNTKSRQTNTSHCPTKTISQTDTVPLNAFCLSTADEGLRRLRKRMSFSLMAQGKVNARPVDLGCYTPSSSKTSTTS